MIHLAKKSQWTQMKCLTDKWSNVQNNLQMLRFPLKNTQWTQMKFLTDKWSTVYVKIIYRC